MPLLEYADIFFCEGQPGNRRFNDIYYTPARGFAESDHVFVQGNRLIERFHVLADGKNFTIGEIGFGTGLNLLNVSRHFLEVAPEPSRLYLISCEKYPIPLAILRNLQKGWPLPGWRDALYRQYPGAHPGVHCLRLDPRIELYLLLGEADVTLRDYEARVDAWFLDGFAPAKNPDAWSPALLREVACLSAPAATAATFTAARRVRDALAGAGFQVVRKPGFGGKRHMLTATLEKRPARVPSWTDPPAPARSDAPIAVIGAGLAGASVTAELGARGKTVHLYHAARKHPAASHVPLAVPYFRPGRTDTPMRRFHLAAWHEACRALHRHRRRRPDILDPMPIRLELTDAAAEQHAAFSGLLDAGVVSKESPTAVHLHGLGAIATSALLGALVDHPAIRATERVIPGLERDDNGQWIIGDDVYETVIVATGWQDRLLPAQMRGRVRPLRGQAAILRCERTRTPLIRCAGYTAIPFPDRRWICFGATYHPNDCVSDIRSADNARLLEAFGAIEPDNPAHIAGGFVGIRASSRDYLPLCGPVPRPESVAMRYAPWRYDAGKPIHEPLAFHRGLYLHSGLGSKGALTAFLGARLIAAMICATPLPVARSLLPYLLPARYPLRDIRRNR